MVFFSPVCDLSWEEGSKKNSQEENRGCEWLLPLLTAHQVKLEYLCMRRHSNNCIWNKLENQAVKQSLVRYKWSVCITGIYVMEFICLPHPPGMSYGQMRCFFSPKDRYSVFPVTFLCIFFTPFFVAVHCWLHQNTATETEQWWNVCTSETRVDW